MFKKMQYFIPCEHELRFDGSVEISLLEGSAELFGAPLVLNVPYVYKKKQGALFTPSGCTLKVSAESDVVYVSSHKNEFMVESYMLNATLETYRLSARESRKRGPCVMICGAQDSGKKTLARILSTAATRSKHQTWHPLLVDLNPQINLVSLPGTIAQTLVFETSFLANCPTTMHTKNELVLFYGHTTTTAAPELYSKLCSDLAALDAHILNERFQNETTDELNAELAILTGESVCGIADGMFVLTPASDEKTLHELVKLFQVDVVAVVGFELLAQKLTKDLPSQINVVSLQRAAGICTMPPSARKLLQEQSIACYFNGVQNNLKCFMHNRSIENVHLVQATVANLDVQKATLPIGTKSRLEDLRWSHLDVDYLKTHDLKHSIVAILNNLTECNVVCFACLQDVHFIPEENRVQLCFVTPCAKLPSVGVFCAVGSIKCKHQAFRF
jgi:polyribonucleotide 5'-hydroxyl-kinase